MPPMDAFVSSKATQLIRLCAAEGIELERSIGLATGDKSDDVLTADPYVPSTALAIACTTLVAYLFPLLFQSL